MNTDSPTRATDPASTADLARMVAELSSRVERLEAELAAVKVQTGPLPVDIVLAISAAVAAYLGKRATVRQIHFRHSSNWAQQGRAAVQASHVVTHGPHVAHHGPR